MTTFKNVRALERGLSVLQAINSGNGIKIQAIAQSQKLPRATVYRLLETLESLGYVSRVHSDAWYPTEKVKTLSSGFNDETRLVEIAAPIIASLGRELLWPIDLLTFRNCAMVVRESTHSISPFSIDMNVIGRTLPLLETASGRTYLAFCPRAERVEILRFMSQSDRPELADAKSLQTIMKRLSQIARVGYGTRYRTQTTGFSSYTGSIAVPVIVDGKVLACIVIIWIASYMKLNDAVARFLKPLQAASAAISSHMTQR